MESGPSPWFGPFRLGVLSPGSWKGAQKIASRLQSLPVLPHLTERAGQVISTEELLRGCSSATLAAAFPSVGIGLLSVSFALGLTGTDHAYAVGHTSSCHLNPVVSISARAGTCFPANVARPLPQSGTSVDIADRAVDGTEEVQARDLIIGTVHRIDHHTGVVVLDTSSGLVELLSTPAEIRDVEIGDVIAVYVEEDESTLTGEEPRPPPLKNSPALTPAGDEAEQPLREKRGRAFL
jgi:hypothetical protein